MDTDQGGLAMQAIRLAVAAEECRRAAAEHPQAREALLCAAEAYSLQSMERANAMAARAERIRRRLRTPAAGGG